MTQDRRIDDRKPTEPLVWDTDQKLITSALQHLHDEKAAASLVEIPDSVPQLHIAIGTKDAMRGLLRDDPITDTEPLAGQVWTAPLGSAAAAQAAVPAELAELTRYEPTAKACQGEALPDMEADAQGDYYAVADVEALFAALAAPAVPSPPLSEGLTDADELSDEERAALDRLDKPEWRASSHLKLRAVLAVEVQRTISLGARIENLQDELKAVRLSAPPSPPLHGAVGAEPVAYAIFADNGNIRIWSKSPVGLQRAADEADKPIAPLYTTPVATQSGAAAAPRQDAWISVGERLPECLHECTSTGTDVSSTVLVYGLTEFGTRGAGFGHYRDNGTWACYEGEYEQMTVASVTHWMPMPKSPVSAPDGGNDRKEKGE